MQDVPHHPDDPLKLNLAIALGFVLLALVRLGIPTTPYFDEVHYLPAARAVLELDLATNVEHPPLAKQLMALGIALFGDNPWGWRLPSLLFGALALFAAMRAAWFSSNTRAASLLTGFFVGTNFLLFVHARIAMLDVFMVAFLMVALWMFAGAVRENETGRWRLVVCGVALGCAMASKWNAVPIAMLPGLAFLVARWKAERRRLLLSTRGWPVAGISLWEAAIWLGALPLAIYAISFWPFLFWEVSGWQGGGLFALHQHMIGLQTQVPEPHPYQSVWWQWVTNSRSIWYLYEEIDGAQRGVMLVGNPVTMWFGLIAMGWCAWTGWRENRKDMLALVLLYIVSMALWVVAPKPVQFYFHYFLPGMFVSGALALGVERMWHNGERLVHGAIVAGALALFVYWFPILTAAELGDPQDFLKWAWIEGWR